MTISNGRNVPTPAPVSAPRLSKQQSKRSEAVAKPADAQSLGKEKPAAGSMAPPPITSERRSLGRAKNSSNVASQLGPTQSALDSDALFVPHGPRDDDDEQWAPNNFEADDGLGWDASANNVWLQAQLTIRYADHRLQDTFHATFRDAGSNSAGHSNVVDLDEGLQPTQRISQASRLIMWEVSRLTKLADQRLVLTLGLSATTRRLNFAIYPTRGTSSSYIPTSTRYLQQVESAFDIAKLSGRCSAIAMFSPSPC